MDTPVNIYFAAIPFNRDGTIKDFVPLNPEEVKPRLINITSILGIKTPDNTLFETSRYRVRIYIINRNKSSKFRRLYNRFAKV
jgi:hypothetical protein